MDCSTREIRNLALIGFMGTGKSTVGRLAATQLNMEFVDTDHLIENHTGRRISQIFEEEGETRFREYEKIIVDQLERQTGLVISTGGGVGANPQHLKSLKCHALVICLWASAQSIWNRIGTQSHRPLLQGPDPLQTIDTLLQQRAPIYKQADVLLGTDGRSLKETSHLVVHYFLEARKSAHSKSITDVLQKPSKEGPDMPQSQ